MCRVAIVLVVVHDCSVDDIQHSQGSQVCYLIILMWKRFILHERFSQIFGKNFDGAFPKWDNYTSPSGTLGRVLLVGIKT